MESDGNITRSITVSYWTSASAPLTVAARFSARRADGSVTRGPMVHIAGDAKVCHKLYEIAPISVSIYCIQFDSRTMEGNSKHLSNSWKIVVDQRKFALPNVAVNSGSSTSKEPCAGAVWSSGAHSHVARLPGPGCRPASTLARHVRFLRLCRGAPCPAWLSPAPRPLPGSFKFIKTESHHFVLFPTASFAQDSH